MKTLTDFERLCLNCEHLLPHPLYKSRIQMEGGCALELLTEAEDEGPCCRAGLTPLTRDGSDCPYFKAKAQE